MVVTIVVIAVIIGVGVGFLAYRFRTEKGIESGITSFRRELHALAPRPGERDGSGDARLPTADPRGLTIMPPEAGVEAEPPDDEPEADEPDAAADEAELESEPEPEGIDAENVEVEAEDVTTDESDDPESGDVTADEAAETPPRRTDD